MKRNGGKPTLILASSRSIPVSNDVKESISKLWQRQKQTNHHCGGQVRLINSGYNPAIQATVLLRIS